MYKGPIKNHLSMHGCMLAPATLIKALALSDLTWGMPIAQYAAAQMWDLQNVTVLKTEVKEDSIQLKHEVPSTTMLGIPVEIDRDLPITTVQLRYQGAVLYEIQNLAVPLGFEEPSA